MSQHLQSEVPSTELPAVTEDQAALTQITQLSDVWQAEFVQTYPELAKCEVWNAGVINGLAILHTCPGIEGSLEVDMGVFVHPLEMRKSSIAAVMDQFQKAIEEKVEH